MPDPINPRLGADQLVERILQQHPGLTLAEVVEELAAFGYDVRVSPALRRRLRRQAERRLAIKRAKRKASKTTRLLLDKQPALPLRLPEQRRLRDPVPEHLVRQFLRRQSPVEAR